MSAYDEAVQSIEAQAIKAPVGGIPKIIHQTFWRPAAIPIVLKESTEKLRSWNREWEYRLYSDTDIEDFVGKEFGGAVLHQYLRIDKRYGAARADLFRYLCMYKSGGVYLDIKSTARKPLDEVLRLDDAYLLSHWGNFKDGREASPIGVHRALRHIPGGEYQQWFIVCAAGHPFLKAVILRVLKNIEQYRWGSYGVGRKGVVATTGPIPYTLAIQPLTARFPYRLVDISEDCSFQYNVLGQLHEQPLNGGPIHYSRRRLPVVRLPSWMVLPWALMRSLYMLRSLLLRVPRMVRRNNRKLNVAVSNSK